MTSADPLDEGFSARAFARRVALKGNERLDDDHGDHRLNPGLDALIATKPLRDAAVLVPIVDRGDEASVILTLRTTSLRKHSGQVAFPGGAIDPEDDYEPEKAALREAHEEIGLEGRHVELLGRLPRYLTTTGYSIIPVLGLVHPPFEIAANPDEVADVFEVPLSFLMNPANHRRESRMWQDQERFYYTMPFGDRFIWGVTAGIIRTLYERLYS
ncbi:8-oxo-dGTP pyrophosphatase MutT, NUDIX family [Phyllobacterium sp. CL33Tsu]|uniref:CoA pyrophosphatase n=1 Tax=Phyllobacterium sp. CL33Tsu TaxID=1798191 RepID=UPI0008E17168|nr:CoA pyrophosphatase [Phyllobacterium sp. CL33Tsu]SFJ35512.1 8-oxo-dGTP pyrophosphatase MutT, NUDIX family [Phyllobacterium sp. CL33Tsu]